MLVDGSSAAFEVVQHALRLMQGGLQASFLLVLMLVPEQEQEPASLYEPVAAHAAEVLELEL